MSDLAIGAAPPRAIFRRATVIALLVIGLIGFAAMLGLGAYLPETPRLGAGVQGHALSNAATGYSGIVRLVRAGGISPRLIRDKRDWVSAGLLVVTPTSGAQDFSPILDARAKYPTLFVMTKWATLPDGKHPGWVRQQGFVHRGDPESTLAPAVKIRVGRHPSGGAALMVHDPRLTGVRFTAPRPLQVMAGPKLEPLLSDGRGGIVLARVRDTQHYLLADADLLDNRGLRRLADAQAAVALLRALTPPGETIGFDLVMNGFGAKPNALRLAFEPPFLAVTVAVLAALLLAGWQAFTRFGPPLPRARAIAFGKAALVDNAAALVRRARAERRLGP
ncbi:MAG: hypothetical protein K2X76_13570, partial [Sphingomonas sp.]|nr:hypothetical protein [Sphingomonas sp.]